MLKRLTIVLLIVASFVSMLNAAEKYAVLVTGAKAPVQNDPYAAFWMDTYLMWEMLYLKGFDPDKIYVLYADGTDCTEGYVNPNRYSAKHAGFGPDYRITDFPATSDKLETVALYLRRKSTDNDFLFVWTFGHGTTSGIGSSNLNLMDTSISDTEFATLFNGIKANKKVYWMAQCYGGGFEYELTHNLNTNELLTNVIFSSAAQSYQESYFADNMPVENKSQPEESVLPEWDDNSQSIEIDWYGASNPQAHWEYNFHMYAAQNQHKQHELNSEYYYKDLTIDGVHYGTVPYSLVDGFYDPRYSSNPPPTEDGIVTFDEVIQWERFYESSEGEQPVYSDPGKNAIHTSLLYPTILNQKFCWLDFKLWGHITDDSYIIKDVLKGDILIISNLDFWLNTLPFILSSGSETKIEKDKVISLYGTTMNIESGSVLEGTENNLINVVQSGSLNLDNCKIENVTVNIGDNGTLGHSNLTGVNEFNNSNINVNTNSILKIKNGSVLKANAGSILNIYPNSQLWLDFGAKLVIEEGAKLNLYGPLTIIMCGNAEFVINGDYSSDGEINITSTPLNDPDKSELPWSGIIAGKNSRIYINNTNLTGAATAISGMPSVLRVSGCDFTDCANGINISACGDFRILSNTFTGNGNGVAVSVTQSGGYINNNTITGFYKGINVMSCSPTLVQNTISDCYMNGLYVAGNNTYMSMVNPIQIGGTIKSGDELGIDNSELNNTLHNNGIDYVPPPYMISKASQIYMVSNSNIYLAKGWNNIYSDANQVPCIRTLGLIPEGEPVRMQQIYAPENFWGYGAVNDSFFALSLPYYINYSNYRAAPYGTDPVNVNLSGNENAQKLLGKAYGCELDGKYDKAIKEYEKIIDKYPESNEAMVAYAKLPENYQLSNYSFDPLLAVYDNKLVNDSSNKKFFKELKVSSHIKAKNYDAAIALSEEMKLEAESEEEIILCDIDIAIANMLKNTNSKSGSNFDQSSLSELQDKLNGSRGNTNPSDIAEFIVPSEVKLYQNYPNPFNPVTQIKFDLAKTTDVKLSVYNISGQVVAELANGNMNAGTHSVEFDGSRLNSGVYYYTLEADGQKFTSKMVLTK